MIQFKSVSIQQGAFELRQLELEIPEGEYAVLMGATGCGKTTIAEALCGLRPVVSGRILINGQDVTDLDCAYRGIGYVPQDVALFPSMRIDQQIAFGMSVRNMAESDQKQRIEELANRLKLTSLMNRYPHSLSGGEKQRVAIARAISFRPRLLCLDEPLIGLDDPTREAIIQLLQSIHRREKLTVLHITHNPAEADMLATLSLDFAQIKQAAV